MGELGVVDPPSPNQKPNNISEYDAFVAAKRVELKDKPAQEIIPGLEKLLVDNNDRGPSGYLRNDWAYGKLGELYLKKQYSLYRFSPDEKRKYLESVIHFGFEKQEEANLELAKLYLEDGKGSVDVNLVNYLKRLADEGNQEAQYQFASILSNDNVKGYRKEERIAYFEKAAVEGHAIAQLELGRIRLESKDTAGSKQNFLAAVNQGEGDAAWELANLSLNDGNVVEATRYLIKTLQLLPNNLYHVEQAFPRLEQMCGSSHQEQLGKIKAVLADYDGWSRGLLYSNTPEQKRLEEEKRKEFSEQISALLQGLLEKLAE